MKKAHNGKIVDMTAEEINQRNIDIAEAQANEFPNALKFLRVKRDALLNETDFYALSDVTMSAEMTTYRQALRDITNGLSTVAEVEAVVFPEKPEA
jgi:hypothetical protein